MSLLCIGHRGAKGHAPENTLRSFRKAIELGVDMVEVDVHSHPQELLVLHDHRLERTVDGRGRVAESDLSYIRGLDAGEGEHIPTVGEVIECIDGRVQINFELKTGTGTARLLADELQRQQAAGRIRLDQVLVSSFDHHELLAMSQHLPEVRLGALYAGVPLDLAADAERLGAWSAHLHSEFCPQTFIADARRRGLKVLIYTANEADDIERLSRLGVDGLFTDYPERVLERRDRPGA